MAIFDEFLQLMAEIEIFNGLEQDKLFTLVGGCEEAVYKQGEKVFVESDDSDKVVMVIEGGFRVESNGNFLASIGKRQVVGEMGVFTEQRRSADVIAVTDTKALELSKEKVQKFIEENPKEGLILYKNVVGILSRHLRENNFIVELNKIMDDVDL